MLDPLVYRIEQARKARDWSLHEMARQAGMSYNTYRVSLAQGRTQHPRIDIIRRAAAAVGLSVELVPNDEGGDDWRKLAALLVRRFGHPDNVEPADEWGLANWAGTVGHWIDQADEHLVERPSDLDIALYINDLELALAEAGGEVRSDMQRLVEVRSWAERLAGGAEIKDDG